MSGGPAPRIAVPPALAASHARFFGAAGRTWIAALPDLAATSLRRWGLRLAGPPTYGAVALVLPVRLADGTGAVLKLQPVDAETAGEPVALRVWDGHGAVRLLRHDPDSGTMLLEALDPTRTLASVADDLAALQILSELLAGLCAAPAPPGLRTLSDLAGSMLDRVPAALAKVPDASHRRLLRACADALAEVVPEAGAQLLHWDLHYDNVLAAGPDRVGRNEPWLAIDPKPLAGDPGFELLAALHNRWDDVVATGAVPRAIRRRFDLMTEVVGLDRGRAAGWTLGRILQNLLWEIESGQPSSHAAPDRMIARTLLESG